MGVSKNNGTPKASTFIGFSIINHPFWSTPIFGNIHIFFRFKAFSHIQTFKLKKRRAKPPQEQKIAFANAGITTGMIVPWPILDRLGGKRGRVHWVHYHGLAGKAGCESVFFLQKLISGIDWIFVQNATAVFMFHCCWLKYHGVSYDWSPTCFQTQWLVHVSFQVSQVFNPTDLAFSRQNTQTSTFSLFFLSPFSVNSNISNFICAKVWMVFGTKNGFFRMIHGFRIPDPTNGQAVWSSLDFLRLGFSYSWSDRVMSFAPHRWRLMSNCGWWNLSPWHVSAAVVLTWRNINIWPRRSWVNVVALRSNPETESRRRSRLFGCSCYFHGGPLQLASG